MNISISPKLIVMSKIKKWGKVTIAIVGDAIMWGIRKELLKTDKHDVKVKFFRSETNEEMEDNLS